MKVIINNKGIKVNNFSSLKPQSSNSYYKILF